MRTKLYLHNHMGSDKAATLCLQLETEGNPYEPGDHVGVFPCNRTELVDGIIKHLNEEHPDQPVQLQLLKEKHTTTGVERVWTAHEKLPRCSLRTLLTRYLDVTTPPSNSLLRFLASCTQNLQEQQSLDRLSLVSKSFDVKSESESLYQNLNRKIM